MRFRRLTMVRHHTRVFHRSQYRQQRAIVRLDGVIVIGRVEGVTTRGLVRVNNGCTNTISRLVPRVRHLHFLHKLGPNSQRPMHQIIPRRTICLTMNFTKKRNRRFVYQGVHFVDLGTISRGNMLTKLRTRIFPGASLQRRRTITIKGRLACTTGALNRQITLHFVRRHRRFMTRTWASEFSRQGDFPASLLLTNFYRHAN